MSEEELWDVIKYFYRNDPDIQYELSGLTESGKRKKRHNDYSLMDSLLRFLWNYFGMYMDDHLLGAYIKEKVKLEKRLKKTKSK